MNRLQNINYEITVNNASKIKEMIENYTLDLALVEGHIENSDLIIKNIKKDELLLVAKKNHPLNKKKNISYFEIEKYPFISREDGSSSKNQLSLHLDALGINLKSNYSCSNTESIKQSLLYTDCISILSKIMIEKELKEGVLISLSLNNNEI